MDAKVSRLIADLTTLSDAQMRELAGAHPRLAQYATEADAESDADGGGSSAGSQQSSPPTRPFEAINWYG